MKPLNPGIDGIRQYNCYGERTDTETPILAPGESLIVLTEGDRAFIAAALTIAANSRHGATWDARKNQPGFEGSNLDIANTQLVEEMSSLASQFETTLPNAGSPEDRAVQLLLPNVHAE